MNFSEETLMAYVDGELDGETCTAIETATASDPELARRIARHFALAKKVRAAFDPVLREAVPDRLKDAIAQPAAAASAGAGAGAVIELSRARPAKPDLPAQTWSWLQWSAIAASLVVGVLAGRVVLQDPSQMQLAKDGGGLVARGALERALSTQLASAQAGDAPVRIGISFLSKSGEYCRTFSLSNEIAGLACRAGADWRLQVVAHSATGPQPSGAYRMAGGDAPGAVMRAVEERIAGSSLDAREEEAALRRGWHR